MKYPVVKDLPPYEPPVSLIIPYDEGLPFNEVHIGRNDEAIIVLNGNSIGEKRIAGAMKAKNDWLLLMDADGNYPRDYVTRVKLAIRRYRFPLMMATRLNLPLPRLLESGMVVEKNYFLKKTSRYPCGKWRNPRFRTDVLNCFNGEPYILIDAFYSHPLSTDERRTIDGLLRTYSYLHLARTIGEVLALL